jgi:hypothetical protein
MSSRSASLCRGRWWGVVVVGGMGRESQRRRARKISDFISGYSAPEIRETQINTSRHAEYGGGRNTMPKK